MKKFLTTILVSILIVIGISNQANANPFGWSVAQNLFKKVGNIITTQVPASDILLLGETTTAETGYSLVVVGGAKIDALDAGGLIISDGIESPLEISDGTDSATTTLRTLASGNFAIDTQNTADAFTILDNGEVIFGNASSTGQVKFSDISSDTSSISFNDKNITNVGNIALDTISSDAGTTVSVTLGTDAGDDFIVGNNNALVVEGDNDRVGIGTTSPQGLLHIFTSSYGGSSPSTGADELVIETGSDNGGISILTSNTNNSNIIFGNSDDQNKALIQYRGDDNLFRLTSDTDIKFTTNASNDAMIINSAGNVGIGTTSPDSALHVYNTAPAQLILEDAGAGGAVGIQLKNSQGQWNIYQQADESFSIVDLTSGIFPFIIEQTTGNIGIGTTSPRSLITVDSPGDGVRKYLQIDSEAGAPPAGDCDSTLEAGRMIIDHTNDLLYVCNQLSGLGWDTISLTP